MALRSGRAEGLAAAHSSHSGFNRQLHLEADQRRALRCCAEQQQMRSVLGSRPLSRLPVTPAQSAHRSDLLQAVDDEADAKYTGAASTSALQVVWCQQP